MSIVVQKFGGTSLNDVNAQSLLLSEVKKAKKEGHDLVVVVSAMGRLGDPYSTDTLINMLDTSNGPADLRHKDLIMSCGEIISCSLISHLLNIHGMKSVPLTGFQAGIKTDSSFNHAEILDIDTSKISKYLKQDKIVVVAGFQGASKDMDITTLGRGGSDVTAVTLGSFLKANRVDIFTDVPGIAVIDPNIVPNPPYIRNINYKTMYNYASNGAKVIHPKAVSIGAKYNIPIHIRTAFLHDGYTIISNYQEEKKKVIGIGVDVDFDFGCISVFLDSNDDDLKEKVDGCICLNTDLKLGAKWHDDYLLIYVDSERILQLTKKLYRCFDIHGLI